jgi:hypothetical protein
VEPALEVERHRRRREREQALARRLLELLTPEEDVAEPGYCCVAS